MSTMYCALCKRPVDANRQIGVGTIALGVVTAGLSFLAIPFYPKRCSICKSTALSRAAPDADSATGGGLYGTALQLRLEELERRLSLTEGEIESANVELDRLRSEQDFYRQLLGDPARRNRQIGGE